MSDNEAWLKKFKAVPMHTYLDNAVQNYRGNPAIDFLGKGWNYGELGELVDRAAVGFQSLGVKKGVKVGLCLPNTPYFVICYFGVLKAGGTVVNFNPLYVERELKYQVEDSETSIMVTMDLKVIFDKVDQLLKDGVLERIVVCPLGESLPQPKKLLFKLFKAKERASIEYNAARISFADLTSRGETPEPVEISPDEDIAILQYTGGTTGSPKGAMLTHRNLSANLEQVRELFQSAKLGEERLLCVIPFFHVFAMTGAQNLSVMLGAQMILLPRFELKQLLQTIKRTRPTIFPGVPTIYNAISNSPDTAKYDLTSINYCVSGGAPLPVEVKAAFEKQTGCSLVEGYGLTEASPVVTVNPFETEGNVAGSIGKPLMGTELRFSDLSDRDKILPDGEKGVLQVSGPQVMAGYWKRPDDSAEVLKDGYLSTADVGYQDENGYVYLVDRVKDLIICSGYNVYPRMIEDALYRHNDVEEAIVIGVPDEYRGEAPKAFVTLHEGSQVKPDDLLEFLKDQISKIEMPKEIEIRTELPKTMIGKLSKKELVEEEMQKAEGKTA